MHTMVDVIDWGIGAVPSRQASHSHPDSEANDVQSWATIDRTRSTNPVPGRTIPVMGGLCIQTISANLHKNPGSISDVTDCA